MAQQTSDIWKRLWRTRGTVREYAFDIAGTWYGPEDEVTHTVDGGVFEQFSIGNASMSTMKVSLYADNVPRAATIKRFIRLRNGDEVSEWLPKGIFFTSRRSEDDGYWEIEAYDCMRKAEVVWEPDQSLVFPMTMPNAANILAALMGTTVDQRSKLNSAYTIDYPANEYTIRDELRYIAAAHGGNWIVTDDGKLLLTRLFDIPDETSCLVTQYGEAIILGGVAIYVG